MAQTDSHSKPAPAAQQTREIAGALFIGASFYFAATWWMQSTLLAS